MAEAGKTEYELARDRRVAENKCRMEELGVLEAAAALASTKPVSVKRQKREKVAVPKELVERRVSGRERKTVNYCELEVKAAREPKAPVDNTDRIKGITLDHDTAEQLRLEAAGKTGGRAKSGGKARGPIDSGKGVRIQGGKVYDSKHGVTCHWCRQKTLEDHVTCTNPDCGHARRMPLSFCAKCLKNRHGEDYAAADASEGWWCPACRGSCGPGCVTCCNCGPCRKKSGLEPTHQVAKLAREAGLGNVHDYLVHLVTGESAEAIAARKLQFPWGAWLNKGSSGGGGGGEGSSEASEQTGGCCSSGGRTHSGHNHAHGAAAQEGGGHTGAAVAADDVDGCKDQVPAPGAPGSVKGFFRSAKTSAAAAGKTASKKAPKGKAVAAAAAAAVEVAAKQPAVRQLGPGAAAAGRGDDVEEEEEEDDVPMLSSQDMRLPRKLRIMQCLGLAPVTVVTK